MHDGVWVPDGETDVALRFARYYARNSVALERSAFYGPAPPVRYRSDKREGLATALPASAVRGLRPRGGLKLPLRTGRESCKSLCDK